MMDDRTKSIIVAVIGAFAFLLMFYGIFGKALPPESTFKVVNQYEGCDVVQYTDPWGAKYHYFLHCK
jgi:hypothetical protein